MPTSRFFAEIDTARAQALLADVAAAIDTSGGVFVMQFTTVVVTAERSPSP